MTDNEIRAYKQGYRDGIEAYAWWKDGEQQVGTSGRTLKDARMNVEASWNYAPRRSELILEPGHPARAPK